MQPKLIDFGYAHSPRLRVRDVGYTGYVVGTPEYMSPEALTGEELDARADIGSFCVTLYETLSGRSPFWDLDEGAVVSPVRNHRPPRLDTYGVEPALSEIVEIGMARNRVHRWRSMEELRDELRSWLDARGGQGVGLPPPPTGHSTTTSFVFIFSDRSSIVQLTISRTWTSMTFTASIRRRLAR